MSEAGPENRRRAEEIVSRSQEISREIAQMGHDPDLTDELLALTSELIARVNLES